MSNVANKAHQRKQLPHKYTSKRLERFFQGFDPDKWLKSKEQQFWLSTSKKENMTRRHSEVMAKMSMLEHRVTEARVAWACISSKTQRQKNFKGKNGIHYEVNIYDNLCQIKPNYERVGFVGPPDRSNHKISGFSKKSRNRLMQKARKLDKSPLPKPYFVTLTYRKNFRDPEGAKQHLNAFFQRWRRKDHRFNYVWKMEPQKRGAVHFHLAIFVSDQCQDNIYKKRKPELRKKPGMKVNKLNALRLEIQTDWATVTKDQDGFKIPVTKFDYIRKKRKKEIYKTTTREKEVNTVLSDPVESHMRATDIIHELYGTNVRQVNNWTQFLGYIHKYCSKVVKNDFGEHVETGRFWGFSYGLDFSPKKRVVVDYANLENLNDFCQAVNAIAFASLTDHLIENAKRKKKEIKDPNRLDRWLQHFRNVFEKQKKRFRVNNEKLLTGGMVSNEVSRERINHLLQYLDGQPVQDFFS